VTGWLLVGIKLVKKPE